VQDTDFQELFEAAQNGELQALEKLIEMYMPSVYKNSFISGQLDCDCLQELTIRLIKCIRNFKLDTKSDLDTYLRNIEFDKLQ